MPKTREQTQLHAQRVREQIRSGQIEDDLATLGFAVIASADAEPHVIACVAQCREHGRSWITIGRMLGVSRQAARQRYGSHS